eukprot:7867042-Ditylum_brightwellii.AAC.1
MKKQFYVEMQADFDHQIVKIILDVNMCNKKLSAHSVSSTSVTSFEMYKRNMDDQEKLPGVYRRSHWRQVFYTMTAKGVEDILTNLC